MKEYQSEFDRLAGSGANQDIKFSPNVDLKIEADRLMEFHDGLIAFLEARGYRLGRERQDSKNSVCSFCFCRRQYRNRQNRNSTGNIRCRRCTG